MLAGPNKDIGDTFRGDPTIVAINYIYFQDQDSGKIQILAVKLDFFMIERLCLLVCACGCMRVCLCVYMFVCVCVCVCMSQLLDELNLHIFGHL